MSSLEISALCKRYGPAVALDGVSLTAGQGELVTLLGPSGCGKTTALRCIVGLLFDPDDGDTRQRSSASLTTPSSKRDFGVVFQNYALFPHLSVAENVGYGLVSAKGGKAERERRVREVLGAGAARRAGTPPAARAVRRPAAARGAGARWSSSRGSCCSTSHSPISTPACATTCAWLIRDVQQASRITAFDVTHDQAEAMAISDQIAVMKNGRVAQFASPREIYQRPAERYVASFTGEANFLQRRGRARAGRRPVPGARRRRRARGQRRGPLCRRPSGPAGPAREPVHRDRRAGQLEGRVVKSVFLGAVQHCEVVLPDSASVRLGVPPDRPLPTDGTLTIGSMSSAPG